MATSWSSKQINTVFASVSCWVLDSFDFFLLVFVFDEIADTFNTTKKAVAVAVMLTLIARPIGALIFGRLAEKHGRKPVLIINVVTFSLFELASAFSPNLSIFLMLRFAYGVAMGGIWGVASSLALESTPKESRGLVSGLFQAGYPMGYLIASVLFAVLEPYLGWQQLFIVGSLPVVLALFIWFKVDESPIWLASKNDQKVNIPLLPIIKKHWQLCVYAVVLMTFFNFFSHGTQDVYPDFLKEQHHLNAHVEGAIAIFYNIASILGGIFFGTISAKIGRRNAIVIASLLALPAIPLWAYASTPLLLGIGAFCIQFMVQGAWGVIPIYLNEIMPENTKAVLPGFIYQLGNLFASSNLVLQVMLYEYFDNNYSIGLTVVATGASIGITLCMLFFSNKFTKKTT